jgi:predicted transcriptional regulator
MQLQGVEQHPVLENQMTMIGEFKHLIEEAVGQHQVPVNQLTMTGELLPHL